MMEGRGDQNGQQDRYLDTLEQLLAIQATALPDVLAQASQRVAADLDTDKIDVYLYDEASDSLVTVAVNETRLARREQTLGLDHLPLAAGTRCVQVFQTGAPYRTGHAEQDPAVRREFTQDLGMRSILAVPLHVAGDRRGVVAAMSTQSERYSVADLRFLQAVAHWLGLMIQRADLAERRRRQRRTSETLQTLLAMADTLGLVSRDDAAEAAAQAEEIARRLAGLARQVLGCRRVGIVTLDPATAALQPLAIAGATPEEEGAWEAAVEQYAGAVRDPAPDPATVARLRAGEVVPIDLTQPPFHDRPTGETSQVLAAPLRVDDRLLGVLRVDYGAEAHQYTPEEIALAGATATFVALVIERTRLLRERAAAAHLREVQRVRSEFVATVSHDLQTPLTAIRAALGLLETSIGAQLGPDEHRLLQDARHNAERLRLRIADLLIANQLEAAALRLEHTRLDLRRVIRAAVAVVAPLLQNQGQTLEVALPQPLPILGDLSRLEQVMLNLLANAHRHTPAGTNITVTGRALAREVRVVVRDNGPGIPPGELDAIFGPFYRLDTGAHGSGLGLAVARAIVERHGGRLWAENNEREGGGAAFHVALPRARPEDVADAEDAATADESEWRP